MKEQTSAKINRWQWVFIALGVIAFPILALTPFSIHAHQTFLEIAASSPVAGCSAIGSHLVEQNQCGGWITPPSIMRAEVIGLAVLALLAIITIISMRNYSVANLRRFSVMHLSIGALVVAVTSFVYTHLRSESQSIITGFNHVGSKWVPVHTVSHGVGLAPSALVLFSILYLAAPMLGWFRLLFSSKYIGAMRKEKLFQ